MGWNGSGNYQRTNGSFSGSAVWQDDANAGFDIVDSRHDFHDQDLAQGINNCLTKDGQNSPTANLSMAGFKHTSVADGSARNQYATVGQLQDEGVRALSSVGGTSNAITASMTPNILAYVTGAQYTFRAIGTNSGATTLKIDSAPAVAIQRNVAALVGGEIVNGRHYTVVYDGTAFQLLNTTANPLFLDSVNNRVGIGTTAPAEDLHIKSAAPRIRLEDTDGGGAYASVSGNSTTGSIVLQADPGNIAANTTMTFDVDGIARAAIDSSGNMAVGSTSPKALHRLDVRGRVIVGSGASDSDVVFRSLSNVDTNSWVIAVRNDVGGNNNDLKFMRIDPVSGLYQDIAFQVQSSSGNVGLGTSSPSYRLQLSTDSAAKPTTNTWTISSDGRIKTNIQPYAKGLVEICQINPVTYDYNGLGGMAVGPGGVSIIAQDLQPIFPECVGSHKGKLNPDDEEETDILNYNGHAITFALINAIKELNAKVETLEARLVVLEA